MRDRADLKVVPAIDPLIPASPIKAIAVAVSSIDIPNELAIGAAYFIESANVSTRMLELVVAAANTSATRLASLASKLKARTLVAIASVARVTLPPAIAAKSNDPAIASTVSDALKPAIASISIP